MVDGVRVVLRVVHGDHAAVLERELVLNARHGHDESLIVLPLEPLLDDLQVKQPEKAAAETLAQGSRGVFLINEGRIVELVLFQGIGEGWIILRRDGVQGREDDRFDILEPGERGRRGIATEG